MIQTIDQRDLISQNNFSISVCYLIYLLEMKRSVVCAMFMKLCFNHRIDTFRSISVMCFRFLVPLIKSWMRVLIIIPLTKQIQRFQPFKFNQFCSIPNFSSNNLNVIHCHVDSIVIDTEYAYYLVGLHFVPFVFDFDSTKLSNRWREM